MDRSKWCAKCLILGFVIGLSSSFEDHNVAFIQTGDELHYFAKRLSGEPIAVKNHMRPLSDEAAIRLNDLNFEPVVLKFGDVPIGVPALQTVTVHNPTQSKVRFDAISGSTVHFHCSFFEHKSLEPGASTSFDVVFLPRNEGSNENLLFVHTSLGTFQYAVTGTGVTNPYRLRPFVGAKIPLNGSFTSSLVMHNPHSSTLKVLEMYTSGGNLHLELPNGRLQEPATLWEIPPYQTKTIMRTRFVACRERNTTGYIKIRTNHTAGHHIVLPVEIEVSSTPGLYSAVDIIDFGTLKPMEVSRLFFVSIFNAANRPLNIVSVMTEFHNSAFDIRFSPTVIQPSNRTPFNIASLKFDARKAKMPNQQFGNIVIRSEGDEFKLLIPFRANIIKGKLKYDKDKLSFFSEMPSHSPDTTRDVILSHTFSFPLAVYNVSVAPKMSSQNFTITSRPEPLPFNVRSLSDAVVIQPNASILVSSVTYTGLTDEKRNQDIQLHVYTNVTRFSIPLVIYAGKLRVTFYSLDQHLDFGTMDSGDNRSTLFAITNDNPIPVTLEDLSFEKDNFSKLELVGTEEGNDTILAVDHEPSTASWKMGEKLTLVSNSFAVFRYTVIAPDDKGTYSSALLLRTPYEERRIPVTFIVEEGAIVSVPERIYFPDSFPGKISSQPLHIYSTFKKAMPVLRLSTLSHDPRVFFESFNKNEPPIIKAHQMTYLGRVFFFPIAGCLDDCYVGLPLNSENGMRWVYAMELPPELPEIDMWLYRKQKAKYDALVTTSEHLVNSTIVVDSTTVKGFSVAAQGELTWPRLIKQSVVNFPLTAIHNLSIVNLTLHNPTSIPVVVQLIPLPLYTNAATLLQMLSSELPTPLPNVADIDDIEVFTLRDSELFNLRPDSPVPNLRRSLEMALGTSIPRYTLSLTLQSGMKVRVRVGFRPTSYEPRSSLLVIRNNLTVLETVSLYGRGGQIEMRIGSRLPFSVHPLLFEIQEKHLKECDNIKRQQHKLPTSLTVRRSFLARNSGELPIYIGNISVNSVPCQNRGFRVLNCEPFVLQPNDTHLLEIAFTPDFTMSWYEAHMQLYFPGLTVPFIYTLAASLPREWLSKCQNALPRPYWEPLFYYSSITALGFLCVCVVASAYLEGDRIITCAQNLQRIPAMSAPFDLNAVDGGLIRSELKVAVVSRHRDSQDTQSTEDSCRMESGPKLELQLPNGIIDRWSRLMSCLLRRAKVAFSKYRPGERPTRAASLVASSGPASTDRGTLKTNELNNRNARYKNGHKLTRPHTDQNSASTAVAATDLSSTLDDLNHNTVKPSDPSYAKTSLLDSVSAPPGYQFAKGMKTAPQKQPRSKGNLKWAAAPPVGKIAEVEAQLLVSKPPLSDAEQFVPPKVSPEVVPVKLEAVPSNVQLDRKKLRKTTKPANIRVSSDVKPLSNLIQTVRRESNAEVVSSEPEHSETCMSPTAIKEQSPRQTAASRGGAVTTASENRRIHAALQAKESGGHEKDLQSNESDTSHEKLRISKSVAAPPGERTASSKKEQKVARPASSTVSSSPFALAATLTNVVVQKSKKSDHASESEESTVPEWDSVPLPNTLGGNGLEEMAEQTEEFLAALNDNSLMSKAGLQRSQHKGGKGARASLDAGQERLRNRHTASRSSSDTSSLGETDTSSSADAFVDGYSNSSAQKKKRKSLPVAGTDFAAGRGRAKFSGKAPLSKGKPNKGGSVWNRNDNANVTPTTGSREDQGSGTEWDRAPGSQSIMKQLQAERKRRVQEYKEQTAKSDWPGFEIKPAAESLWDEEFDPWKGAKEADTWGSAGLPGPSFSLFSDPAWAPAKKLDAGATAFGNLTGEYTRPPPDSSIVAWGPPTTQASGNKAASATLPRNPNSGIWKSFDLESNPDMDLSWTEALLKDEASTPQ